MSLGSLFWLWTLLGQLAPAEGDTAPAPPPVEVRTAPFPALEQPSRAPPPAAEAQVGDGATGAGARPSAFQDVTEAAPATVAGAGRDAASAPATPPPTSRDTAAHALLRQALEPPGDEALPGTPLPLRAALERVQGPAQQRAVVTAYWRLGQATAAYHFALEEAHYLLGLQLASGGRPQALLKASQASAKAQLAESRLAAIQAQHDLAESAQLPDDALPLTTDASLVGPYRTYFEALSARGAVPARLRRLDRTLPQLLQLLEAQADAASAAGAVLADADAAHQDGKVQVAELLDSLDRLRGERRKFLAAVCTYNEAIVQYASAVGGPAGLTPDRLVNMLIEHPGDERSVLVPKRRDDIRRASHDELVPVPHPKVSARPADR
jgi:hypothetical protein